MFPDRFDWYIGNGSTAIFDPMSLSPIVWYDASDADTITLNSGNVSAWDDKSGNDRHLAQATAASQPAYASNTISFDGTDDFLSRNESFMYSAASPVTVFTVMESSTPTNDRIIAEGSSTSDNTIFSILETSTFDLTRSRIFYRDAAGASIGTTTSVADFFESTVTKVYMVEDDLVNITTTANGSDPRVEPSVRPGGSFAALNRFAVGALLRAVAISHANIDMKEIMIFNTTLTLASKAQLDLYFKNKWGI